MVDKVLKVWKVHVKQRGTLEAAMMDVSIPDFFRFMWLVALGKGGLFDFPEKSHLVNLNF